MREVVIASAARTAIGTFGGSIGQISATELGAIVVREAIKRANIAAEQVDEVLLGNVLTAGQSQNPARQASIKAGVPIEVPAWTVGMVCGSGLLSVITSAQKIAAGAADIIVSGGMENMSLAPYLLPKARTGYRMGNDQIVDSMVYDGLTDAFNLYHMGVTAENVAEKYGISREEQDQFAVESQHKAQAAIESGRFQDEIVPVLIPQRKGDPKVFSTDEHPRSGATLEALAKLSPAFKKGGTVTAGNASGINDGAAGLVVMAREKAEELGITPLAVIRGMGCAGVDPAIMGIGPVPAVKKALGAASLKVEDLDLIEANEAFAAQALAVGRELGFPKEKLNVNGGAIALGHPIGASGARILVTLLHEMQKRQNRYGLATLCVGGGQGVALVVERV